MATAHSDATTTGLTAIELLSQRQHEDWIRGWDEQGSLRPELSAQSIATAALRLRDWLAQQDWSWCAAPPPSSSAPSQASRNGTEDVAFLTAKQNPQSSVPHQPDHADHLISQPLVLLAISDPAQFLAWFSATSSLQYPVFLGNPNWGLEDWQQVQQGLAPDLIVTDPHWSMPPTFPWRTGVVDNLPELWEKQEFPQVFTACGKRIDPNDHGGLSHFQAIFGFPQPVESLWIGIPTGGSSGQLRFALHRWKSLTASVLGLQASELTDEAGVINSCCTLPLHHVSGLMQFLRSLLSGGQLWLLPWPLVKAKFQPLRASSVKNSKNTASSDAPFSSDFDQFFISLVPTQLQHLLAESEGKQWLVKFYTVFLGGAPAWPALLEQAKQAAIRLAPTYGMTETASQVITLHPNDFLQGRSGCGKLLPHARIDCLSNPDQASHPLYLGEHSHPPQESSGILKIRAHSLALGYYVIHALKEPAPHRTQRYGGSIERWTGDGGLGDSARHLLTDDLGYCDPDGYFYIVGRASDKIISGGENIFPAAVEAAILATGLVKDTVVLGLTDSKWGERVVAVVAMEPDIANHTQADAVASAQQWQQQLSEAVAPALTPAQRPKQWLVTHAIPRNAQGKIQRQKLRAWAIEQNPAQRNQQLPD